MQIFIQLTTLRSVLLKNMFVHFLNSRGGGLIHGGWICGRIFWFKGKFETKSYIVAAVCKKAWMWPGLLLRSVHSSNNADVALTSSWGCDFDTAESAVSAVVFPDGVRYCMETRISYCIFLIHLFDWQIIRHNIRQWSCRLVRPRNDTLNLISRLAEFSFLPF